MNKAMIIKWTFYLLFAILTISSIQRTIKKDLDFKVFHQAGVTFFDAKPDLYNSTRDGIFTYKYSPFFATLMAPFAFLSESKARIIWAFISALAFILAWVYAEKSLQHFNISLSYGARLLTLLMLLQPVTNNAIQGNINAILLALSMVSIYFAITKKEIQASFWAALAICIKLTPAVLLIFFIGLRRFKLILYSLLFSIVFLLFIPLLTMPSSDVMHLYQQWFRVLIDSQHFPLFKHTNQSPFAVFNHWFGNNTSARILSQLPALVAVGAAMYFIYLRKQLSLLITIFCIYLLASPVVWLEYYVFLLLPLLLLNQIFFSKTISKFSKILYWLRIAITLILVRAIVGKEAANLFAYLGQHLVGLLLLVWILILEKKFITRYENISYSMANLNE